jgi:hypothetical protein
MRTPCTASFLARPRSIASSSTRRMIKALSISGHRSTRVVELVVVIPVGFRCEAGRALAPSVRSGVACVRSALSRCANGAHIAWWIFVCKPNECAYADASDEPRQHEQYGHAHGLIFTSKWATLDVSGVG